MPGVAAGAEKARPSLEERAQQLAKGSIAFRNPQSMREGKADTVEVKIASTFRKDLADDLAGTGTPRVERVPVGREMQVRLVELDPEAFGIASLNPPDDIQEVDEDEPTSWRWRVIPRKAGPQELDVVVTLFPEAAGPGNAPRSVKVLERVIRIEVDPRYEARQFVQRYWEWMLTSLLIPLLGWAGRTAWNLRKKPDLPPSQRYRT